MRSGVQSRIGQRPAGGKHRSPLRLVPPRPENSLIRHLLTFPLVERDSPGRADRRLVELASALLNSHASRKDHFPPDLFDHPVWTLMLFVYVRQGQDADLSIDSLCESPAVGTATVALRWTAKLLNDGIFELVRNPSNASRVAVQLSPVAMKSLDNWLRDTAIRIGPAAQTRARGHF